MVRINRKKNKLRKNFAVIQMLSRSRGNIQPGAYRNGDFPIKPKSPVVAVEHVASERCDEKRKSEKLRLKLLRMTGRSSYGDQYLRHHSSVAST